MDALFVTGHIALWLLVAGLFFPRFVLVLAWLGAGAYPTNNLSDLVNFVLWLIFPRFLIAYYIYLDMGTNNLWFWAYIVTGIVGCLGESGFVHRRIIRRTKVTRNGATTTTVEEEEIP
jgi:hypothetical protein